MVIAEGELDVVMLGEAGVGATSYVGPMEDPGDPTWVMYGCRITRGYLRGCLMSVVLGPIYGPRPRKVPNNLGNRLRWLATFDHEPTEDEKEYHQQRRHGGPHLEPVPVKRRG
jgi:hypothetical protein